MCKAVAAANLIINQTNLYNREHPENTIYMYTKRLQKLLYFSELRYMETYGEKLFSDNFEAWPNGPVIPSIYELFKIYQNGVMYPIAIDPEYKLTKQEEDSIKSTLEFTYDLDVFQLINLSHDSEGPWTESYKRFKDTDGDDRYLIIEKADMIEYIKRLGFTNLLGQVASA